MENVAQKSILIGNNGATCYLNALLQTLYMTPEFRRGIYSLTANDLLVEAKSDENTSSVGKYRKIPAELQKLFARLQLQDIDAVSTSDLTKSFGWSDSQSYQQQDVSELNRILIDAIDRSLKGTPCASLVSDLYRGTLYNVVECLQCGTVSQRSEDLFDFQLMVENLETVEASLSRCIEIELMEKENQFRCSVCDEKVDANRGVRISHVPPILTFSLQRYRYDGARDVREKLNDRFVFPKQLDMRPFVSGVQQDTPDDLLYDLLSVIVHKGAGAQAGHYHAMISDVLNVGDWSAEAAQVPMIRQTSDTEKGKGWAYGKESSKSSSSDNHVDHSVSYDPNHQSPEQILVAILLLQTSTYTISIDKLAGEFLRLSGRSWNATYKKKHGTMVSFLGKHAAMFAVNEPLVTLLPIEVARQLTIVASALLASETKQIADAVAAVAAAEAASSAVNIVQNISVTMKMSAETHWFDFNDSNTRPVLPEHIDSTFGNGNSSEVAYMLVYRRRTLNNATHGSITSSSPGLIEVPEHLLLASQCNGNTETAENAQANTSELNESVVSSGAIIYVFVTKLQLEHSPKQYFVPISDSSYVSDLLQKLAGLCKMAFEAVDLHLETASGELASLNALYESPVSLRDLGISEYSEIFLESRQESIGQSLAQDEYRARKGKVCIRILDRASPPLAEQQHNAYKFVLEKQCTLIQLKEKIIENMGPEVALQMRNVANGRLKTPAGRLYLQEKSTVSSLNFYANQELVFEAKRLPRESELFLRFVVIEANQSSVLSDATLHDVIVNPKTCSIAELKALMASDPAVSLQPDQCRIRTANKKSQPDKVILVETQMVQQLAQQSGSLLFLETAKLRPKGFLTLKLFMRQDCQSVTSVAFESLSISATNTDSKETIESKPAKSITETELDAQSCPFFTRLAQFGELDVSQDSTLEEIRYRIFTEVQCVHSAPSHEFLRLSAMTAGAARQPASILRLPRSTLKRLQLAALTDIFVDFRDQPDQLSEQGTRLTLFRRHTLTHSFDAPVEFHFVKNECATLDQLRKRLSVHLSIPSEHLRLSVYNVKTWSWVDMDLLSTSVKNKTKKKVSSVIDLLNDSSLLAFRDLREVRNGDDESFPEDDMQTAFGLAMRVKIDRRKQRALVGDAAELIIDVEDFE